MIKKAIENYKLILSQGLEKSFSIIIRTIKESNDVEYAPLDVLLKDYEGYKHESFAGIIIFECYTLLQIIKNADITDDNYNTNEKKFNHAIANIQRLSRDGCNIQMLPKPSRILYILKYYLYHHFDIGKEITKYILDEVADKDPLNSRMPKNNEPLNEEIALTNKINDYKFNTHEGREKWQYFDMSIFSLQEFKEFRKIVYNNDILNEIIKDEFL